MDFPLLCKRFYKRKQVMMLSADTVLPTVDSIISSRNGWWYKSVVSVVPISDSRALICRRFKATVEFI